MGSATTQALAATTAALDTAKGVDLDTARELFAAARIVGDVSHLSGALADSTALPATRTRLVEDFGTPFYICVKDPDKQHARLARIEEEVVAPWLAAGGRDYYIHRNGNNIAGAHQL